MMPAYKRSWNPSEYYASSTLPNYNTMSRGMRIVFLPPYSPDYNPIETAFSCTKAWVRRANSEVRAAMESDDVEDSIAMIELAVYESCTAEKAGWFRDCGYY